MPLIRDSMRLGGSRQALVCSDASQMKEIPMNIAFFHGRPGRPNGALARRLESLAVLENCCTGECVRGKPCPLIHEECGIATTADCPADAGHNGAATVALYVIGAIASLLGTMVIASLAFV